MQSPRAQARGLSFGVPACGLRWSRVGRSGAFAIAQEAERSGGEPGRTEWGQGRTEWARGEPAGVSATSQGGPFRTGSDPAGRMKRKTMSAHFATAPYTVPVNVNGV